MGFSIQGNPRRMVNISQASDRRKPWVLSGRRGGGVFVNRRSTQVKKIASNFAVLGVAEVVCRAISMVLTLR